MCAIILLIFFFMILTVLFNTMALSAHVLLIFDNFSLLSFSLYSIPLSLSFSLFSCFHLKTTTTLFTSHCQGPFSVICGREKNATPHVTIMTRKIFWYRFFGFAFLSWHTSVSSYISRLFLTLISHALRQIDKQLLLSLPEALPLRMTFFNSAPNKRSRSQ